MDAGGGPDERDASVLPGNTPHATLRSLQSLLEQAAMLIDAPLTDETAFDAPPAASSPAASHLVSLLMSSMNEPKDVEQRRLAVQATFDQVERVLIEVERGIRVSLTVIKGRSQLLRRQALASGAPDQRVLRATSEIDRAIDQIILRLSAPASPPPTPLPDRPHESP